MVESDLEEEGFRDVMKKFLGEDDVLVELLRGCKLFRFNKIS